MAVVKLERHAFFGPDHAFGVANRDDRYGS
jgi:hypothetical protein